MKSDAVGAFAQVLKRYRESAGLSRQAFAGLMGLDASYIHRLEKGNRRPSSRTVRAMATTLDLDGESLNKWLIAAGHAPMPLSKGLSSATRIGEGLEVNSEPSPNLRSQRLGIEALGLEEPTINRLERALRNASVHEQKRVASLISGTLQIATESLETPVRVAVIPAAGGGHRLLKSHFTQRLLLRVITEAAWCGITDIILVLAPEMEEAFYRPIKESLEVFSLPFLRVRPCIQQQPLGLGGAVLDAEELVGNQPFAVLLPDDVLETRENRFARVLQLQLMMDAFAKLKGTSLLAVAAVPRRKMPSYGVVEAGRTVNGTMPILKLIEKPDPTAAIIQSPNALSIIGRYLLQPEIFAALRRIIRQGQPPFELTTALEILRQAGKPISGFPLRSTRYDVGAAIGETKNLISIPLETDVNTV